ncbi:MULTISPECIES: nucleotide-binding protein [unclassified Thalassospira]|uniref:nucleotide-binding protein n=1 Tax=unclassified Thalassospira TaxID=2648997 RepID=UPI000ECB55DF|nr:MULTISPECIES: nucleotide-binding protein [unclassified Thalassospira]HAI28240.1 hypothetical protein [Thalassospira sp.]|tara:strand:+ start:8564 stop:9385 length:822 start_codon:yes stop_codon:yes gene_type:complete
MSVDEIIEKLKSFQEQLQSDVYDAYENKGKEFGRSRFSSWKRRISKFLDTNLPGEFTELDKAINRPRILTMGGPKKKPSQFFWDNSGEAANSYLASLIIDLESGEYEHLSAPEDNEIQASDCKPDIAFDKVFIVHGRNNEIKERTARFVERLGIKAVILHEQASKGKTIIEKIEEYSDVPYAIVLYTADDLGNIKDKALQGQLNSRARQNVVFEHGYLIAKIGRKNVACLASSEIELPNDISGIVYITGDEWQFQLAKEMKNAGFSIDFNLLA